MFKQKSRPPANAPSLPNETTSIALTQVQPESFPATFRRRVVFIVEAPLRYLFGRDVFISYSRPNSEYAQQLAIKVRERVPKLSFYLDQWASLSGTTLPSSLKRALRWSRMLVLIGTPEALASPNVRMELEVFFRKKGRFVPIDVDGALQEAKQKDPLLAAVCGPGAVRESSENIRAATPSDAVVTRVVNAVTFNRQDQRLRRAVARTTIGVIAIIALALLITQTLVANARETARQANEQATLAQEQQEKALREMGQAQFAAAMATSDQMLARMQARQANEETKLAETKRLEAEGLRDQARADATRQAEIATSRRLANQAELLLRRSPDRLAESTLLAVESMKRADRLGIHSFEADTALRRALSLLPRSLGSRTIDGQISSVALSPDAEYMAAYGETTSSGTADNLVRIRRVVDGQEIGRKPFHGYLVALSNGGRRVAIADRNTIHTYDISGNGKWDLALENKDYFLLGMALSPDGKYLTLLTVNPLVRHDACVVEIREVETGNRITQLDTEGAIYSTTVAYSANGRLLAIGGIGKGPRGKPIDRGLIWNISPGDNGAITSKSFGRPDQLLISGGIGVIAPGIDSRYVATAGLKTTIVWKKTNSSGYEEIARIPIGQSINDLAFSSDGKRLTVLSGGPCSKWRPECPVGPRKVQTWDAIGYWDAFNVSHNLQLETVTFESDDKTVRTVSNGHGVVRELNTTDGKEVTSAPLSFGKETLHNAAATPDGRYVLTNDESKGLWYVWDVIARKPASVAPLNIKFERPALSRDASLLTFIGKVNGATDDTLFVYKRNGSSYVMDTSFALGGNTSIVEVSSEMSYVAVLCQGKAIQIRDVKNGNDRTPKGLKKFKDTTFRMTPDGKHLVVFESGDTFSVWSPGLDKPVATMRGHGHLVNLDLSNEHVIAWFENDPIQILRIRTGGVCMVQSINEFSGTGFSEDEKQAAIADYSGLVRVVDASTCDEIAQFQPEGIVNKLRFSKNGKYLAAGTSYEGGDWTPLDDERWSLRLWLLRPKDLIHEACERLKGLNTSANCTP